VHGVLHKVRQIAIAAAKLWGQLGRACFAWKNCGAIVHIGFLFAETE